MNGPAKLFPRRLESVVWRAIDGKGILLNLENGAYFEVDPVGLSIWQRCDGRTSVAQIAQEIAQEFRAPPARVSRDSAEFVTALTRRQLATLSPRPARARN